MAQSPVDAAVNPICSICLDDTSDTYGWTVVTLQCSHKFHLDCIGSAFNMSGIMQCPNCRNIENGEWLRFEVVPDPDIEGFMEQEQQQILQMDNHGEHWCPYHGRVIAAPAVAITDQDAEVPSFYTTNHHQPASSQVPEVSVSNISMNHLNQAHVPYVAVRDHVIGANRAPVRANLIAPREYASVLPYNQAVNHRIIVHRIVVQPRNRYNGIYAEYACVSSTDKELLSCASVEFEHAEQPHTSHNSWRARLEPNHS